ncbi:MAG: hypothetical protein EPN20_00555 [Magnetospirillum sp.]|nr:MAG: hypothetical protein EPN20_00555 [Magnetospirillum sp.]
MRLSRRALLGAALSGGGLAALGAVPAWALPSGTSLLLVDPSVTARAARDVRKALGIAGPTLTVTGPEILADAAGWLAAAPGRRVVGLVTDGDGILFQQMVPRGSARWRPAAHHGSPAALMSFVVEG